MTECAITTTKTFKEGVEKENSIKALEKAKRLEAKRKKAGWRYVKVDARLQVFVPCDENGKPTKEGKERIERVINR